MVGGRAAPSCAGRPQLFPRRRATPAAAQRWLRERRAGRRPGGPVAPKRRRKAMKIRDVMTPDVDVINALGDLATRGATEAEAGEEIGSESGRDRVCQYV